MPCASSVLWSMRASWPARSNARLAWSAHASRVCSSHALGLHRAPGKATGQGYHLNADLADHRDALRRRPARRRPGQAVLHVLLPRRRPCAAPCRARSGATRYRGRFDQGWERWRETVYARQQAAGIIPPDTRLSERPPWVKAWDTLGADAQRLFARQMEVYAGFLEQTDHHIGRVLQSLERRGELDNTIVMLASDNGASAEGGEHGSFNECQFPNRLRGHHRGQPAGTSTTGAVHQVLSPTTPGAGPGPAIRRCAAGSATCTRAA
jgi:arylsulfatase A-like enzyme